MAATTDDSTKPLTASEKRRWDHFSQTMSHFHEHFKRMFNQAYDEADSFEKDDRRGLKSFLGSVESFITYLTMHHGIEERQVFPKLAQRMPGFANDEKHKSSHKAIHKGLDRLQLLLDQWHREPKSYSVSALRECLDSFKGVLFAHLDEEVDDLKGDNLRKYWKLEEMERIWPV